MLRLMAKYVGVLSGEDGDSTDAFSALYTGVNLGRKF